MAKMHPSNAADYAEIVIERIRQPAQQGARRRNPNFGKEA
jgi:hypothetical protein